MFEIKKQDNNGRKPLATLGNLKLACVELGISDDAHTLRRASRAFDLYNSEKVEHVNDHTFLVKSQYADRLPYQVRISKSGISYCTCPDWMNYSGDSVVPDPHFHCKHGISARIWLHHNGNGWRVRSHALGSKITSECGTETAKALQDKLNGSNGTGDTKSPSHHQLDRSDPFQECEQLDIDQIEGRSNGDLVHVLSNGKYIISYRGIMALAEQHSITFEAAGHDETRTVIVHGRCGSNSRASGKPANGNFTTAVELAKRNAARQLLPLPEIKALEHKAKLEAEFDWEVAKRKCLEIVPDFTFDILIHDLVKAGTLRQAHPSDYNRKEWLVIFDACRGDIRVRSHASSSPSAKRDAETNGNDDGGGTRKVSATAVERTAVVCADEARWLCQWQAKRPQCDSNTANTPSSDDEQRACDAMINHRGTRQAVCCICNRTLTNKLSISRCVGPECYKKVGAQGAQFLRDDEVSDELIKASKLYRDEALQKRILRACLTLAAPAPVKVLNWLGNEYFGGDTRRSLGFAVCLQRWMLLNHPNRRQKYLIMPMNSSQGAKKWNLRLMTQRRWST